MTDRQQQTFAGHEGDGYKQVAHLADVQKEGCTTVNVDGHVLALFAYEGEVYAVDNRCPHMGFPLDRGTVRDGILTCHWHHARFDLATGGTFDLFADDVPAYPVQVRGDAIWVNLTPSIEPIDHQRRRLQDGLERNISLVLAKAGLVLVEDAGDTVGPFQAGLDFGTRYRQDGWGQGLTIHTCMMNLLPTLKPADRPRALYHGLAAVAQDSTGHPPRFVVQPLPDSTQDPETLKRWFRQFIEVRDAEGAERCVISAIRAGSDHRQMADMLFAAATDHRYINIGHPLDFTNKAFEALDVAGWDYAEQVLTSLIAGYAGASRMEESNAWRYPIDLIEILREAFVSLETVLDAGRPKRGAWSGQETLVPVLLDDNPQASVEALLEALRNGAGEEELAGAVAYAAALRIARFHTSNEFGDWDTALHTFTFANAVHQGLQRSPSPELLRGVFDAAMSIYLDRFLNIPPAQLPPSDKTVAEPDNLLAEFPGLLDEQQRVSQAGQLVATYLHSGGDPDALLAALGELLLREDRNFHTIQMVEAAFRQYQILKGNPVSIHVLVAAARYLAAHAPTMRAQGQTFQIARRLHRGDRIFEG